MSTTSTFLPIFLGLLGIYLLFRSLLSILTSFLLGSTLIFISYSMLTTDPSAPSLLDALPQLDLSSLVSSLPSIDHITSLLSAPAAAAAAAAPPPPYTRSWTRSKTPSGKLKRSGEKEAADKGFFAKLKKSRSKLMKNAAVA